MWRHVAANALTLFVVLLFLAAGAVLWGVERWSAPGPLAQAICLRVDSGSTMRRVAADLSDKGAISSPLLFRIGTDYGGYVPLLKAGSYRIPEGASMEEIAAIITRGGANTCGTEIVWRIGVTRTQAQIRDLDPVSGQYVELAAFDPLSGEAPPPLYAEIRDRPDTTFRVVVAEGTTAWQVVQALDAIDVLEGDATAVPPEGTLAPRDYPIVPGTSVDALLARMAEIQSAILAEAWERRAPDLPFDTPQEALTLASIVEKETAIPEERPLVASVLVNRLRRGDMRLQFDPTIIYGITRGQGVLDRPIRQSDIAGETERRLHGEILYNTYQIDGLPAGPIANPGQDAIEAAVNPAETDYLYFVADGSGGHAFAATLEEHNRNVARLRAIESAQQADGGDDAGAEDGAGAP